LIFDSRVASIINLKFKGKGMLGSLNSDKKNIVIKVIGIGGGGCNAVKHIVASRVEGIESVFINTDAAALRAIPYPVLVIGNIITKGLGASANPEIGRRAALEDRERIVEVLRGSDIAILVAGMGGGTGTGGISVVAEVARELGILTVAMVTKPFPFEGRKRLEIANAGIKELGAHVNSLMVLPNEKLLSVLGKSSSLLQAFEAVNNLFLNAIESISGLLIHPGQVNVDLADVKTVFKKGGIATIGTGIAAGENRAREAVEAALISPFFEDVNIAGASSVFVAIASGGNLSVGEYSEIGSVIEEYCSPSADMVVGTSISPRLDDQIKVSIIFAGIDAVNISTKLGVPEEFTTQVDVSKGLVLPFPRLMKKDQKIEHFMGFGYDKALDRIKACYDNGSTELDLSDCELFEVPEQVFLLKSITSIDLSNNYIEEFPVNIFKFESLTALIFNNNKIIEVPSDIVKLRSLTILELNSNQMRLLPAEIGSLVALKILSVANNRLISLPSELYNLKNLETFDLSNNSLASLSPKVGRLSSLKVLNLMSNKLSALPVQLRKLNLLTKLYLHDNPKLNIPVSVLGADPSGPVKYYARVGTLLDFYFNLERKDNSPLNEVKLILVGRGGAGKTSTARALLGLPFDESQDSTSGIALSDWIMDGYKDQKIVAHIWDFAGQVITHALHQFFFSVRSVYILVLTGRENNERDDAEYWLRLIKAFGMDEKGNGPPVLVALNKWDKVGCRPSIDREALVERYPFIQGFVELDCNTKKGVEKLKKNLHKIVWNSAWVRAPFPNSWDKVRRALASTRGYQKQPHLTYTEYRVLCNKLGVTDVSEQDSLADILHNLGVALNYRNDSRLREATVLKPEWLTKHVYALLRRAQIKSGVLSRHDTDSVLRYEKESHMREYLLRIMERFEISYAIYDKDTEVIDEWLIPQALPDLQPKLVMQIVTEVDSTRLRYTYAALPEGLVARAVVRLHDFVEKIEGQLQQWASGAILIRDGARALIRAQSQERLVDIIVVGPFEQRRQLAGLCQTEMRDIHDGFRGLNPEEFTLVHESWVSTAALEYDEKNGKETGVQTKEAGTIYIDATTAINAFSVATFRNQGYWKPRVFISYSKENMDHRSRLEKELKVLIKEGLIASTWHDRMIIAGEEWDPVIQDAIQESDIFIFLATTPALATDYITDYELPIAFKLHAEKKQVVIPIILEECRWMHIPELGKLNALPEKAKAINTWTPESTGWHSVANGIAKVCQELIAANHKSNIV
jgi:internalin A